MADEPATSGKGGRPWIVKAVGEFLIIVVGVLVAFQVESLGDERELREQESALLSALAADLQQTAVNLDSAIVAQERGVHARREVLSVALGERPPPSPDSLQTLIFWALTNGRPELVTGSYEAMVNAGDLRLIQSGQLRNALAGTYGTMMRGHEDEPAVALLFVTVVESLGTTAELVHLVPNEIRRRYLGLSARPSFDVRPLLADREFRNALGTLSMAEAVILDHYLALRADVDEVLAMLVGELD